MYQATFHATKNERRNVFTRRNEEVGQKIHNKKNICRGCHRRELESNFYIMNRQEDVIHKGRGEGSLIFENATV
jgi:hypothetical protein